MLYIIPERIFKFSMLPVAMLYNCLPVAINELTSLLVELPFHIVMDPENASDIATIRTICKDIYEFGVQLKYAEFYNIKDMCLNNTDTLLVVSDDSQPTYTLVQFPLTLDGKSRVVMDKPSAPWE